MNEIRGQDFEQQERLRKMHELMLANETYQKLLKNWSKEEVELYLKFIAGEDAPRMISQIDSETVVGLGCLDFHERFEITLIENIVDSFLKLPGAYRKALHQGNLKDYHEFKTGEVEVVSEYVSWEKTLVPYFEAHPLALRAEISFLKEIANQLGYQVGELALFIARPVNWEEESSKSKETLERFYKYQRKHNLLITAEDTEDQTFPIEIPDEIGEEIVLAEKFYLDHGATYPAISPTQLVEKNGLK